ncbi:hypothetical protein HNY73_001608 [Argiope bruennichi]|uniref:Single domain-containing protein n=1 Tax=Argiope bruennichi TaxID=94029 RepID=A0A8T0FVG2_ARGBR|nr:hypothetical protein HNY73_001608 [Argiope bruennichi]
MRQHLLSSKFLCVYVLHFPVLDEKLQTTSLEVSPRRGEVSALQKSISKKGRSIPAVDYLMAEEKKGNIPLFRPIDEKNDVIADLEESPERSLFDEISHLAGGNGYCEDIRYGRVAFGEAGFDDTDCQKFFCGKEWVIGYSCDPPPKAAVVPGCFYENGTGHYPECCPQLRCELIPA